VATAIGTPITSAIPAVNSVPRTIGQAPNVQCEPTVQAPPCCSCAVSQLLWNRKLKIPIWLNALEEAPTSTAKKAARSTRSPNPMRSR